MELNVEIPIISEEGHEFLLKFCKLNDIIVPSSIKTPIVDIMLARIDTLENIVPTKILNTISCHILDYIREYDVILYFFCDNLTPINQSLRHNSLSCQEFRSLLFSKLFQKRNLKDNLIEEIVVITDPASDTSYYIHLISNKENQVDIDIISSELSQMNK